jgi:hypothetical protein
MLGMSCKPLMKRLLHDSYLNGGRRSSPMETLPTPRLRQPDYPLAGLCSPLKF